MNENHIYHRRMPKFENVDKVTVEVVPRFKEGALSGGQWKTDVIMHFFFKSEEVYSCVYRDMKTALSCASWELETIMDKQDADVFSKTAALERKCCDQVGCSKQAKIYVEMEKITSSQGEYIDRKDNSLPFYRKFCEDHDVRGLADKEDSEANYKEFDPKTKSLGA